MIKNKYIFYLGYLLKHKFYVFIECFKEGLYWVGLAHDFSKFLPSEFIPYANFFYDNSTKKGRDDTGYYKPTDTGNANFDFALVENNALNAYLPRIFHICPFSEDVCTKKQCVSCSLFEKSAKK